MEKEKLDEILKKHAAWLNNEDGGERANLCCADLFCADLRDANLNGANLSCADLSDANLNDADLRGADLSCADLSCADLSCANLNGANLSCADLSCADLNGANLNDADLRGADLRCARFGFAIYSLDRIGSAKRRTTYNATKDIVWCGCFTGTFDEWVEKIRKTYPDENDVYRKEYEAAIAYFKAVAEANREKTQNG